jgi:hypothetical protein
VNKFRIVVSAAFNKSFRKITEDLTENESVRLANAIDNLKKILSLFPESFPIINFEKPCEIPFRKSVVSKNFIIIYLFRKEKVFLINLFNTAQNWKSRIISD